MELSNKSRTSKSKHGRRHTTSFGVKKGLTFTTIIRRQNKRKRNLWRRAATGTTTATATNPQTPLRADNIKDGTPSSIEDIPWAVLLKISLSANTYRTYCGGTIIAEDLVLTAAHCLVSEEGEVAERVAVVAGRTDAGRYYHKDPRLFYQGAVRARKWWNHDGYRWVNITTAKGQIISVVADDIAVVLLKRPLNLRGATTRKICIPEPDQDHFFRAGFCRVAGWGLGRASVGPRERLYSIKGRLGWFELAQKNVRFVPPHPPEDVPGPHPVCRGDSGGPMWCQHEDGRQMLVGVLSTATPGSYNCKSTSVPLLYATMTRVSRYVSWIQKIALIAHPEKKNKNPPRVCEKEGGRRRCVKSGVVCEKGCCISAEPILSFNWIREGVKTISRDTEYDDRNLGTPTAIVGTATHGGYVSMVCHSHVYPQTQGKKKRRGGASACGTPRYRFYHRPTALSDLYMVSDQHTAEFFIYHVTSRQAGDYYCDVTSGDVITGFRSRSKSPVAKLYVQPQCGPPPPEQLYNSKGVATPESSRAEYTWVLWIYMPYTIYWTKVPRTEFGHQSSSSKFKVHPVAHQRHVDTEAVAIYKCRKWSASDDQRDPPTYLPEDSEHQYRMLCRGGQWVWPNGTEPSLCGSARQQQGQIIQTKNIAHAPVGCSSQLHRSYVQIPVIIGLASYSNCFQLS